MTAVTVVHFLQFWSNTINLSSLPTGELQWAIHDKAASSWVNLSSSVMLTMETEASALQYSGKVYHLCLNQVVGRLSLDCTLSAVRGKRVGSSSDGSSSSCYPRGNFVLPLFGSASFGGSVRFQGLNI